MLLHKLYCVTFYSLIHCFRIILTLLTPFRSLVYLIIRVEKLKCCYNFFTFNRKILWHIDSSDLKKLRINGSVREGEKLNLGNFLRTKMDERKIINLWNIFLFINIHQM